MKNIFLAFLILLSTLFASGFGYIIYQENKYIAPTKEQIEGVTTSLVFPNNYKAEPRLFDTTSTNSQNVKFNAWIPTWSMNAGIKTLEERKDKFASISPVFYSIQADGNFAINKTGLEKLQAAVKGTSIKIIPTIAAFDAGGLGKDLQNPDSLHKSIFNEIDQNNFDGIDLDYESIALADKDAFFNHLKYLSTELKKRNKTLAVTVISKWGDNISYGFAPQTRQVEDYAEIAKYADEVRIMAYDYSSQGNSNPGPIAPIEWVESILKYAVNRVPASKIVLGIHLYGYFWTETKSQATALDFRTITDIKNTNANPDAFYSDKNQEAAIKYIGPGGKTYFGYYSDPKTIQARVDLAAKYGINSVVFWRLGDDGL